MPREHSDNHGASKAATMSRYVFFGFAAIAAYFVITEHRAHVIPLLPFLLLAACPLMHFFHHRGHRHEDEAGNNNDNQNSSEPRDPPTNHTGTHQH